VQEKTKKKTPKKPRILPSIIFAMLEGTGDQWIEANESPTGLVNSFGSGKTLTIGRYKLVDVHEYRGEVKRLGGGLK